MARKGNKYQKDDKLKLGGIHIYEDSHGRAVYYDVFTKCGYVLDDREQAYRPYAMRFVIGIFAAVLTYMFELPLWMCLGLGVVAYGVMEVKFRKFLKTVPQMIDFKPKKRIGLVESAADDTKNRILLKVLLYFALAVLIILNAYQQKFTGFMLGLNYLISVFGVVFGIIQIMAFVKKGKEA
ncbi:MULTISPECIES: hypothetical protein [Bacillota]|jgi:type IV secretory pathway TrbD component|uniref:Uncharacterized protein n=1 Tax=[Eubacterium] hominis TaxID=2764325 RepID=A0A7G9GNK2_9FIRM|nr:MULTISPECIES: hypothetical protein [Bacillota]QNM12384.1 hypothetical protein H9Q80_00050 [[Eubacterium] hominis]RGB57491.1 hypothetical protein DW271_04075 [Absiella sp. AM22-9]RGB62402.1 hypothetical protein DW120_04855 [Absiella sp. AM10-20]RGB67805.1 hypothetical protein DW113_06090 [Absiella sp. AM09-45]RGB77531.1 hypothetical protein DW114_06790 [Absiella sp. AM09-50]